MLQPSLLPCRLPQVHCERLRGLLEESAPGAQGPPPPVPALPTFLAPLSALRPWASELTPLGLSFLTCQGVIIARGGTKATECLARGWLPVSAQ